MLPALIVCPLSTVGRSSPPFRYMQRFDLGGNNMKQNNGTGRLHRLQQQQLVRADERHAPVVA